MMSVSGLLTGVQCKPEGLMRLSLVHSVSNPTFTELKISYKHTSHLASTLKINTTLSQWIKNDVNACDNPNSGKNCVINANWEKTVVNAICGTLFLTQTQSYLSKYSKGRVFIYFQNAIW